MAAAAAATAATTTAGENDDDGPPGNTNLRDSSGAPNWNAILKWSVEEGLRQEAELKAKGVAEGGRPKPRTISEEDREWFLKAIESGVVDEVKRIKEITEKISDDPRGDLLATEEEEDERVFVLEELRDRLESVDNATDLGAIGGLTPLLEGILLVTHHVHSFTAL